MTRAPDLTSPGPRGYDLTAQVRGCGPTGALAALALADAGWRVHLQDPSQRTQLLQRQRAYAFTHSSRRLLHHLQLWDAVEPQLEPFSRLQLADLGAGPEQIERAVCFSGADLGRARADAPPQLPVGWIGQHPALMAVLLAALDQHPRIHLALGPDNLPAQAATPDLVVAADGPQSQSRHSLGIGQWQWTYRQRCLTAQVLLRGAGAQQAWELFRPEGPMALLPLGRDKVQLVWSADAQRCRQLEGLDNESFLDHLAGVLPDRLQPDALIVPPQTFGVGLALARRLHRGNTVLVGESGHRCHPVGGQGLNLCWRDVAVLHRLALKANQGRLPVGQLPARYIRRRLPDLLLTLAATDMLVRLFSNRSPLLLPLRQAALEALRRAPLLRWLCLGVMTNGPCTLPQR